MGNFLSVGAEEHEMKMKQIQKACAEKKRAAMHKAELERLLLTGNGVGEQPSESGITDSSNSNGTPANDMEVDCRTGYTRRGTRCFKEQIITKPVIKNPSVKCPYGFIPGVYSIYNMCNKDENADELVFTQLNTEGTLDEVNQWINEKKNSRPGYYNCQTKNVGDKVLGFCTKQCLPGHINTIKFKLNADKTIPNASDVDIGNANVYYNSCKRSDVVKGEHICNANEIYYGKYCVEKNCPDGYEMEINDSETGEPQNIICKGLDVYDL